MQPAGATVNQVDYSNYQPISGEPAGDGSVAADIRLSGAAAAGAPVDCEDTVDYWASSTQNVQQASPVSTPWKPYLDTGPGKAPWWGGSLYAGS